MCSSYLDHLLSDHVFFAGLKFRAAPRGRSSVTVSTQGSDVLPWSTLYNYNSMYMQYNIYIYTQYDYVV